MNRYQALDLGARVEEGGVVTSDVARRLCRQQLASLEGRIDHGCDCVFAGLEPTDRSLLVMGSASDVVWQLAWEIDREAE